MHIAGLQKLSLLGYPGKVACTVFLSGCSLRCPYCHNAELISPQASGEEISQTRLMEFLDLRKGKIDGVCISSGEPTLCSGLPTIISTCLIIYSLIDSVCNVIFYNIFNTI